MDLRLRIEVESFQAEAKLRALNAEVQQLERQLQKGAITQQQYEATLKRISLEAGATRQQLTALKAEQQKLTTSTVATTGAQQALIGTVMRFVGPAAIGAAIKSTIDWGSRLSDLSKKTGISVEALQRLDYAAGRNGVSIEQVSTSVAMFADRLGSGDKSAVAALRKLGLSYQDLIKLKPEQAFERVAVALSKVPSHYEKVALAQDVLGRGGRELCPCSTRLPMR